MFWSLLFITQSYVLMNSVIKCTLKAILPFPEPVLKEVLVY